MAAMNTYDFGAFRVRLTGPHRDGSYALHRNGDNEAFAFISHGEDGLWHWWDATGNTGSADSEADCVADAFHTTEPGARPGSRTPAFAADSTSTSP